jgi:hypothetical protein
MRHIGEYSLETGLADDLGDLLGVGCDHDPIADVEVDQTPNDPEDEGFSGQEP